MVPVVDSSPRHKIHKIVSTQRRKGMYICHGSAYCVYAVTSSHEYSLSFSTKYCGMSAPRVRQWRRSWRNIFENLPFFAFGSHEISFMPLSDYWDWIRIWERTWLWELLQQLALYSSVVAWFMIGCGTLYTLLGLCCMQIVHDRMQTSYQTRVEQAKVAERATYFTSWRSWRWRNYRYRCDGLCHLTTREMGQLQFYIGRVPQTWPSRLKCTLEVLLCIVHR